MVKNIIETEELTKFYCDQYAIYRVNIWVPHKVVYGFLGSNGTGKSMTIGMMVGCLNHLMEKSEFWI